jgi:MFS family permease
MRAPSTADVGTSSSPLPGHVGGGFVLAYALAFASTTLMLIAPLLVSLALKVEDLVGEEDAAGALSLVVGVGGFVALVANPVFGRMSDRTRSPFGMRRPWMVVGLLGGSVGMLVVALAPSLLFVLLGWCLAQAMLNALLAAELAVLADQVPRSQRGYVAGVLGVCIPVASVAATYLVRTFEGMGDVAMFLAPCVVGSVFVLGFAAVLDDRRLDAPPGRARARLRDVLRIFYVAPTRSPDFAWAFASKFLFVLAYALLITYQAYFLIDHLGQEEGDVADLIFLGTLVSSTMVVVASLVGGRLSDRWGRRKSFVCAAAVVYSVALVAIAAAGSVAGFLVGMAIGGVGFGLYVAVDLALVTEVLPDPTEVAKDLGVFNIAGALPFSVGPALAPALLAVGGGSYVAVYAFAGFSALGSAALILRVRGVR